MKPRRLVGLALLVLAMSCSDAVGPGSGSEIKDFVQARQRWQAQNLHTYAFTFQRTCFCANVHPLFVVVLSDTVAGVFDLSTGSYVDTQLGETVDGLFTFVQNAITQHARLIRVEYDAAKGFPAEIDYDGSAQTADDEISFRISDVHLITPQTSP
jgi:hypothetical protein